VWDATQHCHRPPMHTTFHGLFAVFRLWRRGDTLEDMNGRSDMGVAVIIVFLFAFLTLVMPSQWSHSHMSYIICTHISCTHTHNGCRTHACRTHVGWVPTHCECVYNMYTRYVCTNIILLVGIVPSPFTYSNQQMIFFFFIFFSSICLFSPSSLSPWFFFFLCLIQYNISLFNKFIYHPDSLLTDSMWFYYLVNTISELCLYSNLS
jgi:hypothetical protein